MSFPQSVINDAWERAGGKCECARRCSGHSGYRCNKVLDPRNREAGKQWHAHHVVSQEAGGPDTLQNCQILCVECHKNTESYGG
ncbi:MAG: HNH endonuclease [Patescibacteria group bacterium]